MRREGTYQILNESRVLDLYIVYQFIRRLTTPWTETQAFKLGIIDDTGKVLRKASSLKTPAEKNAYTVFDRLVFNIKKMLEKLPFGKTRIGSLAAGLFLIKESSSPYLSDPDYLYESFLDYLDELDLDPDSKKELERMLGELEELELEDLPEDEAMGPPTNNASGNSLAGLGSSGIIVVKKKPKVRSRHE